MQPPNGAWSLPCPVCGRPSGDTGTGPCPQCGLPAVAQAALVVARIGTTLTDLARDRDALLATPPGRGTRLLPSRPQPAVRSDAVAVRSPGRRRRRRRRAPPLPPPAAAAAAAPSAQPAAGAPEPRRPPRGVGRDHVRRRRLDAARRRLPVPRDARRHRAALRRLGLDRPARPAGHRGGPGRRRGGPDRRRPRRRALAGPVPAGGRLAAALVGRVLRRPRGGRRAARPADPDDGDLAAGRPARRPAAAVPAAHRRAVHRPGGGRGRAGRRSGRRRHRAADPPGRWRPWRGCSPARSRPPVPWAGWRSPPGPTRSSRGRRRRPGAWPEPSPCCSPTGGARTALPRGRARRRRAGGRDRPGALAADRRGLRAPRRGRASASRCWSPPCSRWAGPPSPHCWRAAAWRRRSCPPACSPTSSGSASSRSWRSV